MSAIDEWVAGEDLAAGRPVRARSAEPTCRACGCTDADCSVCIGLTGERCGWVLPDLCSACVIQAERLLRLYARIGNHAVSAGPLWRAACTNWRGNGPALAAIERAGAILRAARPNASW